MTPFCNFCYNSGRGDFDSHDIRSRDGKLTCKYLASISCTKCGEKGHTVKYCRSKNASKNCSKNGDWCTVNSGSSAINKNSRRSFRHVEAVRPEVNSSMLSGAFSALILVDDSDVELGYKVDHVGTGVGSDVGSDVLIKKCEETDNNNNLVTITWAKPDTLFANVNNGVRRSWADMVDDDDYE